MRHKGWRVAWSARAKSRAMAGGGTVWEGDSCEEEGRGREGVEGGEALGLPFAAAAGEAARCTALCTFLQRWRILSFGSPPGEIAGGGRSHVHHAACPRHMGETSLAAHGAGSRRLRGYKRRRTTRSESPRCPPIDLRGRTHQAARPVPAMRRGMANLV